MKKLLWILAFALPFVFTACSNDDEDTLEGTAWEYSVDTEDIKVVIIFYFAESTFHYTINIKEDLEGDGILEEDSDEMNGTYTYENSIVKIYPEEKDPLFGRISGNKMTLEVDEEVDELVFTKK